MTQTEIQKNREEIADIVSELKELGTTWEQRGADADVNEEEIARYDSLKARKDNLEKRNAVLERLDNLPKGENKNNAPTIIRGGKKEVTFRDVNDAAKAFFTRNRSTWDDRYAEAADKMGFRYQTDKLEVLLRSETERLQRLTRSADGQEVGSNSRGGYTLNDRVVAGFEYAQDYVWPWLNVCDVKHVGKGAGTFELINDDTSAEGAYQAELDPAVAVDLTWTRLNYDFQKISSGAFPIANELRQDSEEDVLWLAGYNVGARVNRKCAREVTTGDGNTGHLRGFEIDVAHGVNTASATALTYDDLVKFWNNIPLSSRSAAGFAIMMHSNTFAEVMKIKDTTGRPLFQPHDNPLTSAPASNLFNARIVLNDFLDSTLSAGNVAMYGGDMKKIKIRIARDMSIRTSTEKYFLEDAVAVVGDIRLTSRYIDAGHHPIRRLVCLPAGSGS